MKFEEWFESKYANGALANEPYSVYEETKQLLKEAYDAGQIDGFSDGYASGEKNELMFFNP